MEEEKMQELLKRHELFFNAIPYKEMEWGEERTWECPLCGGTVYGCRASCNGHIHAYCPTCDISLAE